MTIPEESEITLGRPESREDGASATAQQSPAAESLHGECSHRPSHSKPGRQPWAPNFKAVQKEHGLLCQL